MTPNVPFVRAGGAAVPALGLGTWPLKGEACARAVAAALATGYRHVDTAAMYANEAAVGEGLRASGVPREAVFLTTKVWSDSLTDGPLQRSAEASADRLGTVPDLLLIHWPNRDVPIEVCVPALCDAKRRGLARHVGVSNFPVALLERAVAAADEPIVLNQCEHHPRLGQAALLAACARLGVAFAAYSPLGKAEGLDDPVIARVARARGCTPAQVVLAWHLALGTVAVPKSGDPARIAQNLGAAAVRLEPADVAAISALARPGGRMIDPAGAPDWDD